MLNITFTPEQKLTSQNERHSPPEKKAADKQRFSDVFEAGNDTSQKTHASQTQQEKADSLARKNDSADAARDVEADTGNATATLENSQDRSSEAKQKAAASSEADHAAQSRLADPSSSGSETLLPGHSSSAEKTGQNQNHAGNVASEPPMFASAHMNASDTEDSALGLRISKGEDVQSPGSNADAPKNHAGSDAQSNQGLLTAVSRGAHKSEAPGQSGSVSIIQEMRAEAGQPKPTETTTGENAGQTAAKVSSSGQTETAMRSLMQPVLDPAYQDKAGRGEGRDRSDRTTGIQQVEPSIAAKPASGATGLTVNAADVTPPDKLENAQQVSFGSLIDAEADIQMFSNLEVRSTASQRIEQLINQPELPRHIARQLAEVVRTGSDRTIELTLNPEELGRVRLSLSSLENGMSVTVLTERSETMDLMRRHIDQLTREFHAMGYQNIAFSFGQQSQQETSGDGSPLQSGKTRQTIAENLEPASNGPVQLTLGDIQGVDIRV